MKEAVEYCIANEKYHEIHRRIEHKHQDSIPGFEG